MTCREARDRLSDYLDNDLAPAMRLAVGEHLRSCAACHEEHRLLAVTCRLLASVGSTRCPVDFTKLATEVAVRSGRRGPWRRSAPVPILRTALAGASAAVALVAVVWQWQRPMTTPEPPGPAARVIARDVAEVEELHRSFAVQQSLDARAGLVLYAPEWAERGR
jgi:predicted anti-sigma-YlaC factor YlaD